MSSPSRPHFIARVTTKVPLRILLITAFVVQISAAVGMTSWLSLRNGQQAIDDLTNQLSQEVTNRIDQHVQNYLDVPQLFNQLNQSAALTGNLPTEFEDLHRYFWQQLQHSDDLSSLYFGSQSGAFIGVQRRDNGQLVLWQKVPGRDRQTLSLDESGDIIEVIDTMAYDPRERPWYIAAQDAETATWSSIYRFASEDYAYLGITAAIPVYESATAASDAEPFKPTLTGVLAIDITLSQISDFLRQLNVSPNGEAFIIERSGAIVASSVAESPFVETEEGQERLTATASQSPVIRATAQHLRDRFGEMSAVRDRQQLVFELDGKPQLVEVAPLTGGANLDWLIVVVIPEADVMSDIYASTRLTLILCGVLLFVSTGIAVLAARWLTGPLQRLNQAAQGLAGGDWDQFLPESTYGQVRETSELAAVFQQMTDQLKQSFETLETKHDELKALDRLKDEFLANTSHELRTPLNGIIGLSESLIEGVAGPLPETVQMNLAMIAASGRRLAYLVNDILDFSHLKHREFELQQKALTLCDIVNVVMTMSQSLVGQKAVQLQTAIAPDLPAVYADENRLQQILYNLVGNAIKFTEQGQVEISAKMCRASRPSPTTEGEAVVAAEYGETDADRPWVMITVSDTGIGIPSDRLDRIFESFEQGDGSTARRYSGTGLGLAITRSLVERHGGHIWVESTVGQGSRFIFTLPTSAAVGSKDPPGSVVTQAVIQSSTAPLSVGRDAQVVAATDAIAQPLLIPTGRCKILIVDDEPINLQVLVNYLTLEQYDVVKTNNGHEVMTLIEQGLIPDLVILDVMMPTISGYELCRWLRDRYTPSELPVIMLTARNQVDDLVEGLTAGANDYLRKPVVKAELLARVRTHLAIARTNIAYARFVPHEFVRLLGHDQITELTLGDQVEADMTIMFADIRSFTQMTELMSPAESFNFLNSYLSRVGPIVRQHHGFIDKYIGDAVMALFPASADDSIQAAIAMQQAVQQYNHHRSTSGYTAIAIGIGVHTGPLMLGTIGEQERMESTVIADAVNLSSRLERLTKLYGVNILTTASTVMALDDATRYNYRFLDRVQVRGKNEQVSVWEFFDGDRPECMKHKSTTRTQFEQAVCAYHSQQFDEARAGFESVIEVNPNDTAAHLYIKRCQRHQRHGAIEEWEQFS